MNFKYEMKMKLEQSNTIWTEIEILDIIKESNEFLIKFLSNGKIETFKNLIIKQIQETSENLENPQINSISEIYIDNLSSGLNGWIEGEVKDVKREFVLVEYVLNNQRNSQILLKNHIRNQNPISENLELNLKSNSYFSYNLDFLNGLSNKSRKIKNLMNHIKNFVPGIKYLFYSISSNDFVIFPEENFSSQEEKNEALNLLDTLMNTIVDFYVEMRQERKSTVDEEEYESKSNLTNISTKKKKTQSKEDKEFIFFTSFNLEKFILETIKSKVEFYKKNPSVKIEHKNTRDPNVIKLELKSNDEKLFEKVKEELEVTQKYFQLNLNEKDLFFNAESNHPNTLKYYIQLFGIYSYHIFKLDENNITLRLIGREKDIDLIGKLLNEFILSKNHLKEKEKELEDLKKIRIN